MEIVRGLERSPSPRDAVVTIGVYDGVHLGHQAVLRLVRELADARALDAVCVTFDRHPAEVVRPESAPKVLTTTEQKLELLGATGYLDRCLVLRFDAERASETADEFVREVLVDAARARVVVVGADFHFGKGRGGNVALLEQLGADLGFEVIGVGLVASAPGEPVYSSTRIRDLLGEGDVAGAAALLGHPYEVRGTVERGDGRGAEIGFPTANVAVPEQVCLPADGVYGGTFRGTDGVVRVAALSLGTRPTFYAETGTLLLEAYVLDFEGDLYDQQAAVGFLDHIRGQERFASVDELIERMDADVEETRRRGAGR
ncbi:MAG: bifunctional riboflavin kinase/FAD synthetase [Acidimicrobiia bacterium]